MTKKQQQTVIDEMMKTIRYIREMHENKASYYFANDIMNNQGNYFAGLAFALSTATGKEYNWSNGTDGKTWALVMQCNTSEEVRLPID